jgi:small-conductance mechanosensitive channel
VTPAPNGRRTIRYATALAVWSLCVPGLAAGQPRPASQAPEPATVDLEAGAQRPAPVLLGGDTVVWITAGAGPYTTQLRADRISRRVHDVVRDRSIVDPTVTITETEGASELRVASQLLMVVTAQDAQSLGAPRVAMAQQYARDLEAAIRRERLRYAPATLVRSGLLGLLATILLAGVLWLIVRVMRAVRSRLERWRERRLGALRVQQAEIVSAEHLSRGITRVVAAIRFLLVLLAVDLYLTYVLGLFPWTRAVSAQLLNYVLAPLAAAGSAFVGYLPNLMFVLVIAWLIYVAIRLVGFFFNQVRLGRIVFASFPAEWADPTNKIIRVLLVAFGIVVAFPYLPASNSPAFTGVSVFMGVLFSLASSSALSNMIAGVVLTYTGAFRLGDRVKVGESFGDIVETSLLATRVRTIKNEDVTIPNSIVLGHSTINYSRNAPTMGLILHTSVTIGYDASWRKVHDLLTDAALATHGLLHQPQPFVWQTALNDFYVTYEINAYTDRPRDMIDIYAALHARIQDSFYAAGVEIMSPHYTSLRDGNAVAIPESQRPPNYHAPAFRVAGAVQQEVP